MFCLCTQVRTMAVLNRKHTIRVSGPTTNTVYKYCVPLQILYTSMASHHKYSIQVWRPHHKYSIQVWRPTTNTLYKYGVPPQILYISMASTHKYSIQVWRPTTNTLYKYGVPPQILYTSMASHMLFASGYLALTKYLGIYGLIILQHRK